jgi:hypothetical protein
MFDGKAGKLKAKSINRRFLPVSDLHFTGGAKSWNFLLAIMLPALFYRFPGTNLCIIVRFAQ